MKLKTRSDFGRTGAAAQDRALKENNRIHLKIQLRTKG
jgi:hypothetical protein